MNAWKDKVAVVTGASTGIGAAIAKKLVAEGMQVVALARRLEVLKELQNEVVNESGRLYVIETDVTKEEEIIKAFKWTEENLGTVHVLINNAGIVKPGSIFDGTTEQWKDIIDTNLLACCVTSREFYNVKKKTSDDGHIVNISSISSKIISPLVFYANVYPPTKSAMSNLGTMCRLDLIHRKANIRVTNIHPGAVETMMVDQIDIPKMKPEDVANAVVYVLSTPASVTVTDLCIQPTHEIAY